MKKFTVYSLQFTASCSLGPLTVDCGLLTTCLEVRG